MGHIKKFIRSLVCEKDYLKIENIKKYINKNNPVIIEIGSNIGTTTALFLKNFPEAKIFCFEPDPSLVLKFKENIKNKNVSLFEVAIGNTNGTTVFFRSSGTNPLEDRTQSGSIKKPKNHLLQHPDIVFKEKISVPVIRLDDWFKQQNINEVDFIWADIQGAEEDLILGATEVLKKTKYFYTEYSNLEDYEGQINLKKICSLLNNFFIHRIFYYDVFMVNINLPTSVKKNNLLSELKIKLRKNFIKF
jgi:FkbM family methyltransferase